MWNGNEGVWNGNEDSGMGMRVVICVCGYTV